MKKVLIFFIIILIIAAAIVYWLMSRPEPEPEPEPGKTFVENIGNELKKTDLIRIDNPRPNQEIESPLVIRGQARGFWFFEGDFPIVLVDWDGLIIAQAIAQAKGDWMTEDFVEFEAVLEFEKPSYSNKGTLILQRDNPSGLPENDDALEIPIIFKEKNMIATIKTNKGDIKIELFSQDAPSTVDNFVKLAEQGFYNNTKFHRVIKGFMIQGGDPLSKDDSKKDLWGTGGPDYVFADEIHQNNKNNAGTIAMANRGPDTNGSQFFINTVNNNYLDSKHTVFGRVVEGMDVITAIENTPIDQTNRPLESVIVQIITIKK